MPINLKLFSLTLYLISHSFILSAESFNTGEVINSHGKKGVLAEDEGYLYLSFNSDTDISGLTLDGIGFGNKVRFNDIKNGDNYALLKVKAGEYYWEHIKIHLGGSHFLRAYYKDDEHRFKVKPGVVNYPGSWSFRAEWVGNSRARLSLQNFNFLSFELEHFKHVFQKLTGSVPFKYQGQINDPYADYLTHEIRQLPDHKPVPNLYYRKENLNNLPMTVLTKLSSTIAADLKYPLLEKYFQHDSQSINAVSPDQSLLLFSSVIEGVVVIGVVGVEKYETYILYQQKLPDNTSVSELDWIDSDSFFMTLSNSGIDRSYVAHMTLNKKNNTIDAQFIKFRYEGGLIDGLPSEQNQLFFNLNSQAGSKHNNHLYKVDVTDEKSIDNSFQKIYKNTKKLKNVVDWLVDKSGNIRAALTVEDDKKDDEMTLEYWFLADPKSDDWRMIKSTTDSDSIFWLLALSEDENYFLVLTNEFSDKFAVHKYATADAAHLGVMYEDSEHDIRNLLVEPNNQKVIGYTYFENGTIKVKYLVELDEKFNKAMANNPELQLFHVQELKQKHRLLLYGLTPNSQGAWFLLNTQSGSADKLFDASPSYEQLPKGKYHVLHTQAEDGVELEGFLVMPELKENNKAPLIVMPHGGPLGVSDFAHNNEMQHFLAAQGFATLKVNYRGSGGYGKEFKDLGKQQWGEKIEQDIDSMTQLAIKEYAVDGEKVCAMGGSYGGYSALMLTYLYPERYLCAVSFAGVMDLPLLFTSRNLSNDAFLKEALTEIVGDPIKENEKLVSKSPLYLLKDMKRPLMIFQGEKDTRVRIEHALRMQQLISVYDMKHQVIIFTDEGHSYSQKNTVKLYLENSLKFIKKHLEIN